MLRIGIIASGRGSNLQCLINAVEEGRLEVTIELVISDRPGAGALGRAEKHGIVHALVRENEYATRAEFDAEMIKLLKAHDVELVVLAGFMRVLGPAFIEAFPERIINIHPALLPSFPGLNVHRKAIRHGVKFSGCTVHFVDKGLDTGPIIIQAVVPILDNDTEESLGARILAEEHRILPEAVSLIANKSIEVIDRRVCLKDKSLINESMAMENPPISIK
ncbi:MAG: phosphoribosylglycinamide formyltransferase [Thermodesulfobacteriota bacterium]